ncbi:MAG: baseplate J/gp47 family protein, partial [Treponemataceae bacterium]
MAFERETLQELLDRTYKSYMSVLKPIEKTPRYNLIKVLSAKLAGINHLLLGDLEFLAEQIFPDTASGENLRLHWSDRVPPLYASCAVGTVNQKGIVVSAIPAGLVYASSNGKRYFTDRAFTVKHEGFATVSVTAQEAGS